jgi:two-component system CheB/CheR fusion protein
LLKLARNGLGLELRTLIGAARKKGAPVHKYGVRFGSNSHPRILDLSVTPLGENAVRERGAREKGPLHDPLFLVLFNDVTPQAIPDVKGGLSSNKTKAPNRLTQRETKRLKQEVVSAQDALRSAIESEDALKEEFQSANEEILSANEELQSTNEELETSKEELQSANEELNTLNVELRHKNSELQDLSNDISNLLNSTRIPVVMLDRTLRIRRLTPTADKLLKVRPSDIGRPLADIRPNIEAPELDQSIAKVFETLQPQEREVKDIDGHWHSLNILPYRTQDNKIDGVVLALQDIDAIKAANEQLKKSSEFFRGVLDTVRGPFLVLDRELRVVSANEHFLNVFQVAPAETVHRFIYDLGNGQWNIPKLRNLLERVLSQKEAVTDFEMAHDFESIGYKTMLLNARIISSTDDSQPMVLLAVDDITERKQAETELRESEKRYRELLNALPVAVTRPTRRAQSRSSTKRLRPLSAGVPKPGKTSGA